MSQIDVVPMAAQQTQDAVSVLARAFVTNPLHVAAFGPANLAANEAFFRTGLAVMKGEKHLAVDGSRILGVVHWVGSPGCQVSFLEKLRMIPRMVSGLGVPSSMKVISWVSTWAKHDPNEPHSHLGPIAVEPEAQGRSIGTTLMQRYCADLDRTGMVGYLETDRPENVDFYRRFGFEVSQTTPVLGVETYFMRRG